MNGFVMNGHPGVLVIRSRLTVELAVLSTQPHTLSGCLLRFIGSTEYTYTRITKVSAVTYPALARMPKAYLKR